MTMMRMTTMTMNAALIGNTLVMTGMLFILIKNIPSKTVRMMGETLILTKAGMVFLIKEF